MEKYLTEKGIISSKEWIRVYKSGPQKPEPVTLMTYIRNCIHHPENTKNPCFTSTELKDSIDKMVELLRMRSNE
jgi:hypothetical protein